MFNWFKKRPRVTRADLEALIEATPDADPKSHVFLVPERLQYEILWLVLKRPFSLGLWIETYKEFSFYPARNRARHGETFGHTNSMGEFIKFIEPVAIDLTLVERQLFWPAIYYR